MAKGVKRKLAKHSQHKNFDQILLDAIDEALSSLGENVKRTVYFQLEALFKIGKQDIPIRLSDFSNALEQLFGLGATHLELLFMKNLHDKIGVTFKWPEYEWPLQNWILHKLTFKEYVRLVRQEFEATRTNKMNGYSGR